MILNNPLKNDLGSYMCQFGFDSHEELHYMKAILNHDIITCFPPVLNYMNQGKILFGLISKS